MPYPQKQNVKCVFIIFTPRSTDRIIFRYKGVSDDPLQLIRLESKLNRLLHGNYMEESSVIRMWITNKNNREITVSMSESMIAFLSIAIKHGCIGSTFAEDDKRVIVYTKWSEEETLEQFRSSKEYHTCEGKIIQSFAAAGFEIPDDILFNSTAKILFSN